MTQNENLRKATRGLQLVYAGLILLFLSAIAEVVLAMYFAAHGGLGMKALILVGVGGVFVCGLLDISGKIQCLAISDRLQATRFIFGSIVCAVAGYVLMAGQSALVANAAIAAYYRAETSSLREVLIFAAYMLLLVFMRRLAEFVGSGQLAREAKMVLFAFIVAAPAYVGSVAVLRAGATLGLNHSFAAMTMAFVSGVAVLVMFVRYANLITYLRRAMRRHVESQAQV